MKQCFLILFILVLYSCDYLNVKKVSKDTILKEELKTFNWENVDAYPSFFNCDSLQLKAEKRICFEHTLHTHINKFLQNKTIVVGRDLNDTLTLKFRVSKHGNISFLKAEINSSTKLEIPEINSLIIESLDSLPQISAAIKRSQPVTTEFEIPLIIKVN